MQRPTRTFKHSPVIKPGECVKTATIDTDTASNTLLLTLAAVGTFPVEIILTSVSLGGFVLFALAFGQIGHVFGSLDCRRKLTPRHSSSMVASLLPHRANHPTHNCRDSRVPLQWQD